MAKSHTALAAVKTSFNADSESMWGIHTVAGPNLYYNTDEAMKVVMRLSKNTHLISINSEVKWVEGLFEPDFYS